MKLSMDADRQLAILDRAAALSRVGGDTDLLREMAQLFLEEYPRSLSDVRLAVRARDARAVERSAHSLKGSVGNFAADAAFQAAFRLEMLGRVGDMSNVDSHLAQLERALSELRPALVALGDESA
jgi:two-component system, sensor histidine kinase and response regulator